jgi:hypothetical protein
MQPLYRDDSILGRRRKNKKQRLTARMSPRTYASEATRTGRARLPLADVHRRVRKNRSARHRADESRVRENLKNEYREKGTLETTGDGTPMGSLVAFRRFIMSLRRERERQGLSLSDVAERAKIDKAALSRLENGQQLNPTVNTLARYVSALSMTLTFGMNELEDPSDTPLSTDKAADRRTGPSGPSNFD